MKTAGNVLSAFFDEGFMKKAQGYSKLFDSWKDITDKNGIAAAADHSRIKDLDNGILLLEMDHPGCKQILQTKQSKLLNDFRIRFPELDITGISLMLGKAEAEKEQDNIPKWSDVGAQRKEEHAENKGELSPKSINSRNIDSIKDDDFKETLKKLGQTITEREKK